MPRSRPTTAPRPTRTSRSRSTSWPTTPTRTRTSIPASVTVTVAPAHGTTSVDPPTGAITYTPDADWSGTDTFTYQVCDTGTPALCDTAVVTVDVTAVNDAPVAADDTATTDEDAPVTVDVLANDGDLEGALDPASVSVIGGPSHGSVSIDPATGRITYTPDPNYNGPDTFTYQVCDTGTPALCDTAVVTVDVDRGQRCPGRRHGTSANDRRGPARHGHFHPATTRREREP